MPGLSRKPGVDLAPPPSVEEASKAVESSKPFDPNQFTADYSYWFVAKAERKQREVFFGQGALTILLIKPDPDTQPPKNLFPRGVRKHPMLRGRDVDGLVNMTGSRKD